MKFSKLHDNDKEVKKLRKEKLLEDWKDIEEVLHYKGLLYISKIIYSKLINKHHNDLLASVFRIEKAQKLIVQKYYWLIL